MKKLFGCFIFGGSLFVGGCLFLTVAVGLREIPEAETVDKVKNTLPRTKPRGAELLPKTGDASSLAIPLPPPHPKLLTTIYVDDSIHEDLTMIDAHIGFLGSQIDGAHRHAKNATDWIPIDKPLDHFKKAILHDINRLKSDMRPSFPNEATRLFEAAIDILNEDIKNVGIHKPRFELVNKISTEFFDHVKAESSKTLSTVPEEELIQWTKDRVKKNVNFPQTVKFGWFIDVISNPSNRSAKVIGTFKASNAFGLATKHEYSANWKAESDSAGRTWKLYALHLDGATVYVNSGINASLEDDLTEAMALGRRWKTRRDAISKVSEKVEEAVNNHRRWMNESREFKSDKGTSIVARYRSSKLTSGERIVYIEKQDGSILEVKLNRFSPEDQKFLDARIRGFDDAAKQKWGVEARVFTSTAGSTLKARLKSAIGAGDDRIVSLETEDGSVVKVPIKQLSDEDREFIVDDFKARRK